MNWPALTPECSQAIAEVLKDVVQKRPKDLFEHVANQLQERSGLDREQFKASFEGYKRQPQTYVLEDRCPQDEDPLIWVPMRYNDDTILQKLRSRCVDLLQDVLSKEPLDNGRALFDNALVTFPELMYLRNSPEEDTAAQAFRAFALCTSGCPTALQDQLEDDDPNLSFRCQALMESVKSSLLQPFIGSSGITNKMLKLEAVLVCVTLRLLGGHAEWREKYGGGERVPEKAALHAIENCPQVLPSFVRLSESSKRQIVATLQAYFTMSRLLSTEIVPANFFALKDLLVPISDGIMFFLCVTAVEYLVECRTLQVPNEEADIVKLVSQCAPSIEKNSASRSYELYLRKRAERHQWRLMRDDFMFRAIIRLCCLMGSEDAALWTEMLNIVETLTDQEKEVLKNELGTKDGLTCTPVFLLGSGSELVKLGATNQKLPLKSIVRLVIRILEDAATSYDQVQSSQIRISLDALLPTARDFAGGMLFEDTQYVLNQLGPTDVMLSVE
mmetsp:Transcript_75260/g.121514  ORF Transcript_75260/g.121514 Transcript_75260/m.121514 type:complete len:501 (-) Transcript_75260:97-1599(-)|eukprot:CAMPEP_0115060494 /NCGR_PEP_ID=MMETSP0227-20121206/7493_1 /TAXON_ID=89957 /ORGANISM="Polarella glacialis, Strain CCMP 1383" /LENGTH=500 /DNA_ID=CAMNT_0002445711 /DNA_START=99 /DNA_END=1601 /DNA_ORIENTATION=+